MKTCAGALSIYGRKRAAFLVVNGVRERTALAILRHGRQAGEAAATHAALALRVRDLEDGVDAGALGGIQALFNLVPLAFALIALSSSLALGALGLLIAFGLALAMVRGRFRARHARAAELGERLHAESDELVRHLDLWRTFGADTLIVSALRELGRRTARAIAGADAAKSALSGANEALGALALVAAVGAVEAGWVTIDPGALVAFAMVFFLMYRPLRDLGDARAAADRGAAAWDALETLARAPRAGVDSPRVETRRTWPHATLDLVGAHVEREGAADAIDLHVAFGELVAIVGPTGAGKTTLLRGVLGLEALAGSLRWGEDELRGAGVGPDERPFAWVPQEPAIVAGTLVDNVLLGAPHATRDDAARALRTIGANALERRLDERLSSGGPELSGGERQWVAIARAVATDQPCLLLDEPTSGLDAASQSAVIDALRALRGARTVLLVTHRREPLAICDRVVELRTA